RRCWRRRWRRAPIAGFRGIPLDTVDKIEAPKPSDGRLLFLPPKRQAAMNLIAIIAATLVAGIGSVWIAALLLRVGVRSGSGGVNPQHLLSLAAGALLATAFMHLLPEACESRIEPGVLFGVLLFGLVFFFLLDKAELWHHGHEHHHGHSHDHGHAHAHDHDHSHGHDQGP